jgi:hypothetical protein
LFDPRVDPSLTLPELLASAQPSPVIRSMPDWNEATGASRAAPLDARTQ